jgi:chromosomal replication initiation ATPase DnaA
MEGGSRMSISRQEKLKLAMTNARHILGKEDNSDGTANSKLNTLRDVKDSEDTRKGNLIARTKVTTRPTFDLIADKVLGKQERDTPMTELSNNSTLAKIASQRMNKLRDEKQIIEIEDEKFGDEIGFMSDGRPIWTDILDTQRGYSINSQELQVRDTNFKPKWPPILRLSDHKTWKTWSVLEENQRASGACEKVIEKPGKIVNPLLILGKEGTGKSHILHATSQAMIRRQDGNVHLLSVSRLASEDSLPNGWQEAVAHASLIAIDDLHLAKGRIATDIGLLIDYSLNMGVQIITTSRLDPKEWEASRLWEVMKSATSIWVMEPSAPSMITHLRRKASGRALLFDDSMLATIVKYGESQWRGVDAAFEKIALAIESGERIVSAAHVSQILDNAPKERTRVEDFIEKQNLEDIASRVINDTLDHLYSDKSIGGIELKSELPELSDDWEVPDITIDENTQEVSVGIDGSIISHSTNTLSVDERDKYLLEEERELTGYDQVRV